MQVALLFSVFFIAVCGLVYELIAGTVASYVLGDSVTQFSTVIGVYLFSMGIGSYLSRFVTRNLTSVFVRVEIIVGLVGGFSAAILFGLSEQVVEFRVPLYSLVVIVGTLVGLEIPLVMRILRDEYPFKDLVSKIFTFDYIGALLASILFPLVLVPHLGLMRTCFLFGIINVAVAFWALHIFRDVGWARSLRAAGVAAMAVLVAGFVLSDRILSWSETGQFQDNVVYSKTTPYQRLVVTKGPNDVRLYINGNLQFSSRDEYRYHEVLVHTGLSVQPRRSRILVLGGGDGLAVREILRYPDVERVTLVDLDPAMTRIFSEHPLLTPLNQNVLRDPRVTVVNEDAFPWVRRSEELFDFIVIDFPDPSSFSLGKLYSTAFYTALEKRLAEGGALVVQSTSPLAARRSYWCIVQTLETLGFRTTPYHALVPSFGEWGFVLASRGEPVKPDATRLPPGLRFVDAAALGGMLAFPPDMARVDTDVNKLNNQALVRYFDEEWSEYVR